MYKNPSDFAQDMLLVWKNSQRYNPPHNQVHLWSLEFEHAFKRDMEVHKIE